MKVIEKPASDWGDQLSCIQSSESKHAGNIGDSSRTVIEAPTEDFSTRLGFNAPCVDASNPHRTPHAETTITRCQPPLDPMMQPTTAELRTAIEVLKKLDQRIQEQAAHSVMQLPETELGASYAAQIEARALEQTGTLNTVVEQLQTWRDELLQQKKQNVSQRI